MDKRSIMKRNVQIIIFFVIAGLPTIFCSVGWEDQAIELAKEIPAYPNATFIGEFITSYPSSLPGAGITYRSKSPKEDLLNFYIENLSNAGWEITNVDANSVYQNVPYIVESQRAHWICQVIIEQFEQTQITINISQK